MTDELKKMQTTLDLMKKALMAGEDYARMEDIIAVAKSFKSAFDELKMSMSETERRMSQKMADEIESMANEMEKMKSDHKKEYKKCMDMMERFNGSMRSMVDEKMVTIKSELMDAMPNEETMTKRHNEMELEMAQIGTNVGKLGEDIKSIRDEIEQLGMKIDEGVKEQKTGTPTRQPSAGVRRVFQPYIERFSGQTDGSTKTFYLKREPLRTDTIEVSGTDFPIILDPTVDFTVKGKAVTLTDAVPAPSQGATLIIKYFA